MFEVSQNKRGGGRVETGMRAIEVRVAGASERPGSRWDGGAGLPSKVSHDTSKQTPPRSHNLLLWPNFSFKQKI